MTQNTKSNNNKKEIFFCGFASLFCTPDLLWTHGIGRGTSCDKAGQATKVLFMEKKGVGCKGGGEDMTGIHESPEDDLWLLFNLPSVFLPGI